MNFDCIVNCNFLFTANSEQLLKNQVGSINANLEGLRQEVVNSNLDQATITDFTDKVTYFSDHFDKFDVNGISELESASIFQYAAGVERELKKYSDFLLHNIPMQRLVTEDQGNVFLTFLLEMEAISTLLKQVPTEAAKEFRKTNAVHKRYKDLFMNFNSMTPAELDAALVQAKTLIDQYAQDAAQLVASYQTTTSNFYFNHWGVISQLLFYF